MDLTAKVHFLNQSIKTGNTKESMFGRLSPKLDYYSQATNSNIIHSMTDSSESGRNLNCTDQLKELPSISRNQL